MFTRPLALCAVLLLLVLPALLRADDLFKNPAPAPAALKAAAKVVNDAFKDDLLAAKTPAQKAELTQKLMDAAKEEKDPDSRFALLIKARDIAIDAPNVADALTAIDTLETQYAVDALKMKNDAALMIAKSVRAPDACKAFAEQLAPVVAAAITADRYDIARSLAEFAQSAARASNDPDLIAHAGADLQQISVIQDAYIDIKKFLTILDAKPIDPEANLKVGKFRCLIKADFVNGLPLLARSNDAALKALADLEIAGAAETDDQVKLADAWFAYAEKLGGLPKTSVQNHAAKWYRDAQPNATGLAKAKIESRLKALAPPPAVDHNANWTVLFRANDPALWNTDTAKGPNAFAIPLKNAPKGIHFLKLAIPNKAFIIVPATNESLGACEPAATVTASTKKFFWNGDNHVEWKAYHLGIFDKDIPIIDGCVDLSANGGAGYGFGNHCGLNDTQGYGWEGKEIGQTVFEISVKTTPLTEAERKNLRE